MEFGICDSVIPPDCAEVFFPDDAEARGIVRFIYEAHKGQKDKQGNDYYTAHLVPVAMLVPRPLVVPALAHDIIEDTATTFHDLIAAGFAAYHIRTIDALTKRAGEGYEDYLDRVKRDIDATKIKLADITSNLSRASTLPAVDSARLMRKYYNALRYLAGVSR